MQEKKTNLKKQFVEHLQDNNWVVLGNEKYSNCRLYNTASKTAPPLDFIQQSYQRFLAHRIDDDASAITAYVMKSLPLVTGEVFQPASPKLVDLFGSVWINSYRPYIPSHPQSEVSPLFHEYLVRLFPKDCERKICIQWIAHIFQCPEVRPSWHLLLSSDSGTGKGFLVENILAPLLSMQTATVSSYSRITDQFSTMLSDKLLILLDDPKSKSDDQMTKIKSALTEPRILVERKHQEAKMAPTYARVILASNEIRPLRLDEDERRWFAPTRLIHKEDRSETQAFLSQLANWLAAPGALDSIFHWLMEVDLSDFNPKHIHQSSTLLEMIGASKSALENLFEQYIADHLVLKQPELRNFIIEQGYNPPGNGEFSYHLNLHCTEMTLSHSGQRRSRYWVRKDLSKQQAIKLLEQHGSHTDDARIGNPHLPF